jgi:putative zinc finger protein
MRTMSHHVTLEELSAYLDAELAADESGPLAAHLAECPECADRLAGLERTVGQLRRVERVVVPRLLEAELLRRVAGEPRRPTLPERLAGGFRLPALQPAFASIFVLVVGAALLYVVAYSPTREATLTEPAAARSEDSAAAPAALPQARPDVLAAPVPPPPPPAAPRPAALRRRAPAPEGVPGGVVGGVYGGIAGGVPGGVAGGVIGGVPGPTTAAPEGGDAAPAPVEVPAAVPEPASTGAAAQEAVEPEEQALRMAAKAVEGSEAPASPRLAAGRRFEWVESLWREEGLTEPPAAVVAADDPAGLAVLERHPDLRELLASGPVRLRLDHQVVELRPAPAPSP